MEHIKDTLAGLYVLVALISPLLIIGSLIWLSLNGLTWVVEILGIALVLLIAKLIGYEYRKPDKFDRPSI